MKLFWEAATIGAIYCCTVAYAWPEDKVSHASVELSMDWTTLQQLMVAGIDSSTGSLLQFPTEMAAHVPEASTCRTTAVAKSPVPTKMGQCLFAWITAAHCVDWLADARISFKRTKVGKFFISSGTDALVFRNPSYLKDKKNVVGDVAMIVFEKDCTTVPDSQVFALGSPVTQEVGAKGIRLEIHGREGKSLYQTTDECLFDTLDNSDRMCADRVWDSESTYAIVPGNSGSTLHDPITSEIRGVLSVSSYKTDNNEGNHVGFSIDGIAWAKRFLDEHLEPLRATSNQARGPTQIFNAPAAQTFTHRDQSESGRRQSGGVETRVEGNWKVIFINGREVARVPNSHGFVERVRQPITVRRSSP